MAGLPRTLSKADRAYHTGGVERLGERGEQAREGDPVRAVGDAGSPVTGAADSVTGAADSVTGAADSVTGDEDLEIGAAEPEEVARRWRGGGDEVATRWRGGASGPERADERTRTSTPEGTGT